MKYHQVIFWGFILLLTAAILPACQRQETVCPPVTGTTKPNLAELLTITPTYGPSSTPLMVEIGGKMMSVDKLVTGSLCNDNWSGTVYVGCDAQVAAWDDEGQPLFLAGCNLSIEPGTVVYVAAHNDAAYYKGCSCHTGGEPIE
jgi:hypothetical protein